MFLAAIVVVGLLVLTIVLSPFFIIPALVVAGVALFASPILASIAGAGRGRSAEMPTTREASYEPVDQPQDRQV